VFDPRGERKHLSDAQILRLFLYLQAERTLQNMDGLLQHCKEFAQTFARAAELADALASDHQKIADEIKK
jgi:uncharacterized membrane-anchored protein YhcB (DUF1043 family)